MRTVYFFTSPMCGACEEWKPTVEAFILSNSARCFAIRCNPNLKAYEFGKWKVKYTPSAMVMEGGTMLRYIEGQLLTAAELEAFVFADEWKPHARAKRTTAIIPSSPATDDDYDADFDEDEDDEDE